MMISLAPPPTMVLAWCRQHRVSNDLLWFHLSCSATCWATWARLTGHVCSSVSSLIDQHSHFLLCPSPQTILYLRQQYFSPATSHTISISEHDKPHTCSHCYCLHHHHHPWCLHCPGTLWYPDNCLVVAISCQHHHCKLLCIYDSNRKSQLIGIWWL